MSTLSRIHVMYVYDLDSSHHFHCDCVYDSFHFQFATITVYVVIIL